MFRRIVEGLDPHNCSVHDAGPYSEPDEAPVLIRISRCDEQKYAQRRINTYDHHEIVRVPMAPSPARGPNKAQRINTEYENQAKDDQRDTQIKYAICIRHFEPSQLS